MGAASMVGAAYLPHEHAASGFALMIAHGHALLPALMRATGLDRAGQTL